MLTKLEGLRTKREKGGQKENTKDFAERTKSAVGCYTDVHLVVTQPFACLSREHPPTQRPQRRKKPKKQGVRLPICPGCAT